MKIQILRPTLSFKSYLIVNEIRHLPIFEKICEIDCSSYTIDSNKSVFDTHLILNDKTSIMFPGIVCIAPADIDNASAKPIEFESIHETKADGYYIEINQ